MYDNLRSILKNRGWNDYKPEHTGKRKRQKNAGTAVDLTVPMEDYHECVRLVREYRRAHFRIATCGKKNKFKTPPT